MGRVVSTVPLTPNYAVSCLYLKELDKSVFDISRSAIARCFPILSYIQSLSGISLNCLTSIVKGKFPLALCEEIISTWALTPVH